MGERDSSGSLQTLGDYALLDCIGRGGMGQVYRAKRSDSDRVVALKVAPPESTFDAKRLERFRREGEITAGLRHPSIVAVHDAGIVDGRPFLAYHLVEEARTLRDVMGEWSIRRKIAALRDVSRALGHAHQRGVVHRDVKPENVLVTREGTVLLADFGLASATGMDRMTKTHVMLGTPLYIAPELVCEGTTGSCPQSDVYAMGVILYELLVGEHPYAEYGMPAVISPIRRVFASPADSNPDVPEVLSQICMRSLERETGRRYPHGDALADALDGWLEGGASGRIRWAPIAVVLGAVAMGGAGWALTRGLSPSLARPSPAASTPVQPAGSPSPVQLSLMQETALTEVTALLERQALNDPSLILHLGALTGALRPDERGAALAEGVAALLGSIDCDWSNWGVEALEALQKTGARPADTQQAVKLSEQLWWSVKMRGLSPEGYQAGHLALIRMDVDIEPASDGFRGRPLRPPPTQDPALRYLKLHANSRMAPPVSDESWSYQDLLVLGEDERLGPTTRARALALGLRSVLGSDPNEAVAIAERAVGMAPDNGHVRMARAHALIMARGAEALPELNAAWDAWRAAYRGRDGVGVVEGTLVIRTVRTLVNRGLVDEALTKLAEHAEAYGPPPPQYNGVLKRVKRAKRGRLTAKDEEWFRTGAITLPR